MQPAILGLGPLELVIIIIILGVLFLPTVLPKLIKRFMDTFSTVRDLAGEQADKAEEEQEKD